MGDVYSASRNYKEALILHDDKRLHKELEKVPD